MKTFLFVNMNSIMNKLELWLIFKMYNILDNVKVVAEFLEALFYALISYGIHTKNSTQLYSAQYKP